MSRPTPMRDAIRDAMSPEAVAAAASFLLAGRCDDEETNIEVQWFANELIELLGGPEEQNRICREIGL